MITTHHEPKNASFAILGATVLDGTGRDPLPNAAVLVEDNLLRKIGSQTSLVIPRGATIFEAPGMTILPGLIDCHVHLTHPPGFHLQGRLLMPPSLSLLHAVPNCRTTLEAGVTTVRDAGGTPAGVKLAVEQGLFPGPRMLVAVGFLSQTGGHGDDYMPCGINLPFSPFPDVPYGLADGKDEVQKKTRELLRAGADWIKICTTGGVLSPGDAPTASQFTLEEISAAVSEAEAQGKHCMAHAQGTKGIKQALRAGVASIEHGIWLDDEAIDLMKRQGTYLVPTLVAPLDVIAAAEANPGTLPQWALEKARLVARDHATSFQHALEAGVKIAMGTDSGVGPHGHNARELGLMVQYGMTPMQAICASTHEAARLLALQQEVGSLEAGKLADLLVIDGDPLNDIRVLEDQEKVVLVIKGGQVVKNVLQRSPTHP